MLQSLKIIAEELPIRIGDMWSGYHTAEVEISYSSLDDWFVSDIRLQCENRKPGNDHKSYWIALDQQRDQQLFAGFEEAIRAFWTDHIEDQIIDALEDAREYA